MIVISLLKLSQKSVIKRLLVIQLSIAYQAPAWPASRSSNGISKYVEKVVPALMEMGVRPLVFAYEIGDNTDDEIESFPVFRENLTIHERFLRKLLPTWFEGYSLRQSFLPVLRSHKVDILEMEEARGDSLLLGKDPGVRIALRLHGPWFLNGAALGVPEDADFFQRVEREGLAIKAAEYITAPSQDVIDRTAAYYNIDLSHAVCIPNPIEIPEEAACWCEESANPHLILFVGRFDRHKGADILLQAFAKLWAVNPLLRLAFVGPDRGLTEPNGRCVGIQEYLINEVPSEVGVAIQYHGELGQAEILALRQKSVLTVVPSRYDNFPYTALESLSLGCPTIASDAGGASEMIVHGVNGWLFETGSVNSLISVITDALERRESLGEIAREGRLSVIDRYSPTVVARQLFEYYRGVL